MYFLKFNKRYRHTLHLPCHETSKKNITKILKVYKYINAQCLVLLLNKKCTNLFFINKNDNFLKLDNEVMNFSLHLQAPMVG